MGIQGLVTAIRQVIQLEAVEPPMIGFCCGSFDRRDCENVLDGVPVARPLWRRERVIDWSWNTDCTIVERERQEPGCDIVVTTYIANHGREERKGAAKVYGGGEAGWRGVVQPSSCVQAGPELSLGCFSIHQLSGLILTSLTTTTTLSFSSTSRSIFNPSSTHQLH
ncbi:hypothetical protein EX30DRAFT_49039 [Ascodesmis nigricans]|uniref:Uncharacterized protein n=1 Tax=Ascodesmis nigricans TaxID=341454 RepID=A0A4S2MVY0_9PEZI|nr:hypothetical protein EX30DRAFT_49039 [Ascodesmis nigricans]